MSGLTRWVPAGVLLLAVALGMRSAGREAPALRAPLATGLPASVDGRRGKDVRIDEKEARMAGMTAYVMRVYAPDAASDATAPSLFVSYYDEQTHGRTIHSPRNCLPGSGWESLSRRRETIGGAGSWFVVNRTLIQRGEEKAVVLYWYQGRGRTEADEYRVKWDLLRDATLRGRTDEALVRVLVPVTSSETAAFAAATGIALQARDAVNEALPI